jgi:hypothetical protein
MPVSNTPATTRRLGLIVLALAFGAAVAGCSQSGKSGGSESNDLVQIITVAFVTSGITAILTRWTDRASNREERLMDLYSEFIGIAWADLDRAEAANIAMDHCDNTAAMAATLEQHRLPNRSNMLRLACQISLLESSCRLREIVSQLGQSQAFMPFWWVHERPFDPNRMALRERYDRARQEFRARLEDLIETVATLHRFRGSLSGFPMPQ